MEVTEAAAHHDEHVVGPLDEVHHAVGIDAAIRLGGTLVGRRPARDGQRRVPPQQLLEDRYNKFRQMARFFTE